MMRAMGYTCLRTSLLTIVRPINTAAFGEPRAKWRLTLEGLVEQVRRMPLRRFVDRRHSRPAESALQWHESALFFVQCGIRTVNRGSRILRDRVSDIS
jgi:hypothetical protein